jgi:guanylate kinase
MHIKGSYLMNRVLCTIFGPSASGKDTLLEKLINEKQGYTRIVNDTTRLPRPGENDKVDYNFISNEEYTRIARSAGYLTCVAVHNRSYGVRHSEIDKALTAGRIPTGHFGIEDHLFLWSNSDIDNVKSILLLPPSFDEWQSRMEERINHGLISMEEYRQRGAAASEEIEFARINISNFLRVISADLSEMVSVVDEYVKNDFSNHMVGESFLDEIGHGFSKFTHEGKGNI